MPPIVIVQGGLWGSEAKGAIAGYLCKQRNIDYCVRTGATNAGHTVIYNGEAVKLQQLPVGFVNPGTKLVLGVGSLIDPVILEREIALLSRLTGTDIKERLFIDPRAGIHLAVHQTRSADSGRHHRIGATGKGCSEALIDRINGRGTGGKHLFGDIASEDDFNFTDTEALLNNAYDGDASILLEGTQGTLLDLYLGPYPYTTHKQTGPGQWMLEAGLSPALQTEIVSVVRTFPIRVAGNSGPMPCEISWMKLARDINTRLHSKGMPSMIRASSIESFEMALKIASKDFSIPEGSDGTDQHLWDRVRYDVALSELNTAAWKMLPVGIQEKLGKLFELTTVTKKLRRIARLDGPTLADSVRQSRPHWIALTFMNYLEPENWFRTDMDADAFDSPFVNWVNEFAPVKLLTYGPADEHVVAR